MDLDEVVYTTACGLDVHFAFVAACLVTTGPKGKPKVEEREFPTNQKGLRALREWLSAGGCEAVGMEATGVYWMPVYAALEGAFELVVGNPQHMKNARGRKTDRMDARWIAGQMRHDRIKPLPLSRIRPVLLSRSWPGVNHLSILVKGPKPSPPTGGGAVGPPFLRGPSFTSTG
jgi:transposase